MASGENVEYPDLAHIDPSVRDRIIQWDRQLEVRDQAIKKHGPRLGRIIGAWLNYVDAVGNNLVGPVVMPNEPNGE